MTRVLAIRTEDLDAFETGDRPVTCRTLELQDGDLFTGLPEGEHTFFALSQPASAAAGPAVNTAFDFSASAADHGDPTDIEGGVRLQSDGGIGVGWAVTGLEPGETYAASVKVFHHDNDSKIFSWAVRDGDHRRTPEIERHVLNRRGERPEKATDLMEVAFQAPASGTVFVNFYTSWDDGNGQTLDLFDIDLRKVS